MCLSGPRCSPWTANHIAFNESVQAELPQQQCGVECEIRQRARVCEQQQLAVGLSGETAAAAAARHSSQL